jgi:hypothetical protein
MVLAMLVKKLPGTHGQQVRFCADDARFAHLLR